MALPVTKLLIGSPLGAPFSPISSALNNGTLEPATTTQFVIADEYGNSIVFHGNFTVAAGEVTGGTATGYDVFAGATKTIKASGYNMDGAALFEAVQNYGIDSQPFFDLVEGQAIKLVGSKLGDQFGATDGGDVLLGKAGADFLYGWDGDDTIKGGKGDDLLEGDDGFDALTGNEGADVFAFHFDLLDPPPTSFDKIKDFEHGKDHIALTVYDGMGQLLPPGALDNKYFHKGTEAETADQHVIYDKKTGKIYLDGDGAGGEAQFLFAKLKADTKLHADDFYSGLSMVA